MAKQVKKTAARTRPRPSSRREPGTVRFRGKERVCVVDQGLSRFAFSLNPSESPALKLAAVADAYQLYRYNSGPRLEWKSFCPADAHGGVGLGLEYNAQAEAKTYEQLATVQNAKTTSCQNQATLVADQAKLQLTKWTTNEVEKNGAFGPTFYFAASDTGSLSGELWLHYDVTFSQPAVNPPPKETGCTMEVYGNWDGKAPFAESMTVSTMTEGSPINPLLRIATTDGVSTTDTWSYAAITADVYSVQSGTMCVLESACTRPAGAGATTGREVSGLPLQYLTNFKKEQDAGTIAIKGVELNSDKSIAKVFFEVIEPAIIEVAERWAPGIGAVYLAVKTIATSVWHTWWRQAGYGIGDPITGQTKYAGKALRVLLAHVNKLPELPVPHTVLNNAAAGVFTAVPTWDQTDQKVCTMSRIMESGEMGPSVSEATGNRDTGEMTAKLNPDAFILIQPKDSFQKPSTVWEPCHE